MQENDQNVSYLAIDQYFRELRWSERLTDEEEQKYLARLIRGYEEKRKTTPNGWLLQLANDARDHLVENFQPLLVHLVKRSHRHFVHLELLDLLQEANIALLKALEKHAASQDIPLTARVTIMVRQAIWDASRTTETGIDLPREVTSLLRKIKRFEIQFVEEYGSHPQCEAIAQALDLSPQEIEKALLYRQTSQPTLSLENHCTNRDGEAIGQEDFLNLFAAPILHDTQPSQALKETIEYILENQLSNLQKEALRLHFGLNERRGLPDDEPLTPLQFALVQRLRTDEESIKDTAYAALQKLRRVLELHQEGNTLRYQLLPQYQYSQQTEHEYTIKEAAAYLGVHEETISRYILSGRIPAKKRRIKEGTRSLILKEHLDNVRQMEHEYTIKEAAAYLGVHENTICNYIRSGRISAEKRQCKGGQGGTRYILLKEHLDNVRVGRQSTEVA